jgi:pimeloyl-ACP methyl ester carboxylesterase
MEQVISRDGTTIAFERSGVGSAVILVGGAFQYRAIDPRTAQLAELLAANFTVFHYDRRGRGDSGDTAPYTVEREIEDIAALINAAGGSASVFGMSSGALLALDAANHGLAITRLAVYEPPVVVDDSRPPLAADYMARLTGLLAADRRGDAVALFMTEAAGVPAEYVAAMRAEPFWPTFEAVAHTLAYDATIMGTAISGQPLPAGRWAAVTIPTLVIDGGASPVHMHSGANAIAGVLPAAQRRTLEDQAHAVAPEVLAPVLAAFFGA